MDPAIWICIFLPMFIVLVSSIYETQRMEKQRHILKKIIRKEGRIIMSEMIKAFVGKECSVNTMNGAVTGTIEAVEENWIVLRSRRKAGGKELINADYVSHIKEIPAKKSE